MKTQGIFMEISAKKDFLAERLFGLYEQEILKDFILTDFPLWSDKKIIAQITSPEAWHCL